MFERNPRATGDLEAWWCGEAVHRLFGDIEDDDHETTIDGISDSVIFNISILSVDRHTADSAQVISLKRCAFALLNERTR